MKDLGISVQMTPLGMRSMRVTIPAMKTLAKARAILRFAGSCYGQDGLDALAAADYLFDKIAAERGADPSVYDRYLQEGADEDRQVDESVPADDSRGSDAVEAGYGDLDGDAVLDLSSDEEAIEDDEPPM